MQVVRGDFGQSWLARAGAWVAASAIVGVLVAALLATTAHAQDTSGDGDAIGALLSRLDGSTTNEIANRALETATVPDMLGQMLLIGFHGKTPNARDVKRARAHLAAGRIGGVIFMGRNIGSSDQVKALTRSFQAAAPKGKPPFIGVDQEGGRVQRLGPQRGYRRYPTAQALGRGSVATARETYGRLAGGIARHGFNLNFGPVVDLNLNRRNPVIARLRRSYGADPQRVTDFAAAFVHAHRANGVLTSAKHFPGHGSSWTDSHKDFVDLTKTWRPVELAPYRALARAGLLDAIMVGHLYHPRFSPKGRLPTTLSPAAIRGAIRQGLGFDGLVITDDLEMDAVSEHFHFDDTVVRSIAAGNDVLMMTNGKSYDARLPQRVLRIVQKALKDGRLTVAMLRESFGRIMRAKGRLRSRATAATD